MELIGPLQLRIMLYLWEKGPSTVHAVVDHLNAEPGSKRVRYTTASTVIASLEARQICSHAQVGRQFEFSPLITRQQYTKQVLKHACETLFQNDSKAMREFVTEELCQG